MAKKTRPSDQWISDALDSEWLVLENSFGLRYQRHAELDGARERLPVDLEVDVCQEDGRLVLDRLTIKRRPGELIDSTVMRELQLPDLLLRVLRHGVLGMGGVLMRQTREGTGVGEEPVDPATLDEADRAVLAYKVAYAIGQPPTAAVAKQLGISSAAAAKRIERLRGAGRLRATEPGRKGI